MHNAGDDKIGVCQLCIGCHSNDANLYRRITGPARFLRDDAARDDLKTKWTEIMMSTYGTTIKRSPVRARVEPFLFQPELTWRTRNSVSQSHFLHVELFSDGQEQHGTFTIVTKLSPRPFLSIFTGRTMGQSGKYHSKHHSWSLALDISEIQKNR